MYWVLGMAVYGLGATVVSSWYGGARAKISRHHGPVGMRVLVRTSVEVFFTWWFLAPMAYFHRALRQRRGLKELH